MTVAVTGALPLESGSCRVIAEAGANHNNSVERAIELAREAAAAGAWAVKYQLYKADKIAIPSSPKYWEDGFGTASQYEAFKLSDKLAYSDYREISDACRDLGIAFFATPFDFDAVEALEDIDVPLYKVASGDITYKGLLREVAQTGKPILLSTGASTVEEIEQAIEWIGHGPDRLVLLTCTLTYPTPDEAANFARLETFRSRFTPYSIGFSDHTIGPEGGWMASALGAVCIEKHYTLDKGLPDVPDHAMSVDPLELRQLVDACNRGTLLRGETEIAVHSSEIPARDSARRSVVLEEAVAEGEVLTAASLTCKRPGTGLPPADMERLYGRRALRPMERGHMVDWSDVAPA